MPTNLAKIGGHLPPLGNSGGKFGLIVEHTVLVDLKAAKAIDEIHRAHCLNYLKASGLHLCVLLNFGKPRLEIKRIVLGL